MEDSEKKFIIKEKSKNAKIYNIYLHGEIEGPENYITLENYLRNYKRDDEVNLYINSRGGNLHSTMQILNAMEDCSSKIKTICDGLVASAATLIFLSGDSFQVKDNSFFMVHNYSSHMDGKGNEIFERAKFCCDFYKNLFKRIYKGFLTDKEFEEMIEGKDFWFSSSEVKTRLKKLKNK